jgi:hypothetical protein
MVGSLAKLSLRMQRLRWQMLMASAFPFASLGGGQRSWWERHIDLTTFGRVDVVVNDAGVFHHAPSEESLTFTVSSPRMY